MLSFIFLIIETDYNHVPLECPDCCAEWNYIVITSAGFKAYCYFQRVAALDEGLEY